MKFVDKLGNKLEEDDTELNTNKIVTLPYFDGKGAYKNTEKAIKNHNSKKKRQVEENAKYLGNVRRADGRNKDNIDLIIKSYA